MTHASPDGTTSLRESLTALPKIELHRHLEGSLRLNTLVDIAHHYDLDVPTRDPDALRQLVQIMPDSPPTVEHFLSKFATLRQFYCAPEVIQRVVREAIEDAALDNIKYMELRFTPRTLARLRGFLLDDVLRWVTQTTEQAQADFQIKVRLIVSINRHEGVLEAERVARAVSRNMNHLIVALDLAGAEEGYPANPFAPIFKEALQAGLQLTIHAGEWAGPSNVRYAIERLGAARIGHGVRIVEDDTIVRLAREHGTIFEVCPTSNLQSGVVRSLAQHPLHDMIDSGLRTTLNTDDPSISDITLADELFLGAEQLGLGLDAIRQMTFEAAEGAFLPDSERKQLVEYYRKALGL